MGKKGLTDEDVAMIASVAAEKAVEAYRKMEDTERKKRERTESKPAKTKKLLTAYRRMKTDVADTEELTEAEKREFRWRFIEDLMGSAGNNCDRTEKDIEKYEAKRKQNLFYVQIIDRAMKLYKQECESSPYEEDVRRYREVHAMYIADEPKTVQQISELENVSDKTVYNDFRIACAAISVYLLGA